MTQTLEFIADIHEGGIVPPTHIAQFLRHCGGRQARIILGWGLKKRSLKQNSYYKGIIVPMFGRYLRDGHGCDITDVQVDLVLKKWADFMRDKEMPDGTVESVPCSTTELDTKGMSEFTEKVIAEIAKRTGFYIPLPDEQRYAEARS